MSRWVPMLFSVFTSLLTSDFQISKTGMEIVNCMNNLPIITSVSRRFTNVYNPGLTVTPIICGTGRSTNFHLLRYTHKYPGILVMRTYAIWQCNNKILYFFLAMILVSFYLVSWILYRLNRCTWLERADFWRPGIRQWALTLHLQTARALNSTVPLWRCH